MSISRRGFLGAMLAAASAPAVVKAENLMKIFVPPEKKIITAPIIEVFIGRGLETPIWTDCGISEIYPDHGLDKRMPKGLIIRSAKGDRVFDWTSGQTNTRHMREGLERHLKFMEFDLGHQLPKQYRKQRVS